MSIQLKRVFEHLRGLRARAAAAAGRSPAEQLQVLRGILDDYGKADPSTSDVVAAVRPAEAAGRPCEWLLADNSDPQNRLLYLHGGSWTKGGLDSHRAFSARLAQATGCAVLAVDYRLAPEHPFPAGLEDCVAAYLWLREDGPAGPGRARHTFIAGDSAGGNLTLAALLALRDRLLPLPDGAVVFSPATDFTGSGESMRTRAEADPILVPGSLAVCAAAYLQHGEDLRHPLVSPLYGDLHDLPPLLIQVGDAEILLDDARRFAVRAEEAGVDVSLEVWPEMPHAFPMFAPYLPQASAAIGRVAEFVRSRCRFRD